MLRGRDSTAGGCRYHQVPDNDCLRTLVEGVEARCGRFTDYGLRWVRGLVNTCVAGYEEAAVLDAAQKACGVESFEGAWRSTRTY